MALAYDFSTAFRARKSSYIIHMHRVIRIYGERGGVLVNRLIWQAANRRNGRKEFRKLINGRAREGLGARRACGDGRVMTDRRHNRGPAVLSTATHRSQRGQRNRKGLSGHGSIARRI